MAAHRRRVVRGLVVAAAALLGLSLFRGTSLPSTLEQQAAKAAGAAASAAALLPTHAQPKHPRAESPAAPELPPLDVDVWWHAPFLDGSSFGMEAAGLVLPLRGVLAPGRLHIGLLQDQCPAEAGAAAEAGGAEALADPRDRAELLLLRGDPAKAAIVVCHNLPPYMGRPTPSWRSCQPCPPPRQAHLVRYAVARAMVETDRMHSGFVEALNTMDEVWAPTEASARVLRDSGVRVPLRVLPLPVDTEALDPRAVRPLPLPAGGSVQVFGPPRPAAAAAAPRPFVFLSVFKWELRKGYDALLSAFLSEFGGWEARHEPGGAALAAQEGGFDGGGGGGGAGAAGAGVELHILTRPFLPRGSKLPLQEHLRQWARTALGPRFDPARAPRVFVSEAALPRAVYVRTLAAADVFVLPTRGEGWGLPIAEAMALGLPVIATNWSGPTAYLDETVGYPLPYDGLVPVPATEPYWLQGGRWVEPSVPTLRRLMRRVASGEGREEAAARGRAARRRMVERYSQAVVARRLAAELRRIEQQTGGGAGWG